MSQELRAIQGCGSNERISMDAFCGISTTCGAPTDNGVGQPVPCTNRMPCTKHPFQTKAWAESCQMLERLPDASSS